MLLTEGADIGTAVVEMIGRMRVGGEDRRENRYEAFISTRVPGIGSVYGNTTELNIRN